MMVMYFSPIESMKISKYTKMLKKENTRKCFLSLCETAIKTISYKEIGN